MNIEPASPREQRILDRIQGSTHPAMKLAAPGLLAAGIILLLLAVRNGEDGGLDGVRLCLSLFFFWQAWSGHLMQSERRTVLGILDRLTGGTDAGDD